MSGQGESMQLESKYDEMNGDTFYQQFAFFDRACASSPITYRNKLFIAHS